MTETAADTPLAIAAQALVEVPITEACRPGVIANLAILAGHAAIVRAAPVEPRLEAAEIFHP